MALVKLCYAHHGAGMAVQCYFYARHETGLAVLDLCYAHYDADMAALYLVRTFIFILKKLLTHLPHVAFPFSFRVFFVS